MKILALNCGSSTVKYQLYETSRELITKNEDRVLAKGAVERIGTPPSLVSFAADNGPKEEREAEVADHQQAVEMVLECLTTANGGVLGSVDEIHGIGHRVVHAGEHYADPVLIDDEVERRIEECCKLAPLHNPHNLRGYRAVRDALPGRANVAVFDTSFHQTVPPKAYLFGLPYELYERDRIRRYGFHGTSHKYVAQRFAALHGGDTSLKVIICHLGSGSSVCAVDGDRSVDTSMGFTPLDGLMMGTRPGHLDPGVLLHLMSAKGMSVADLDDMLNRRSGLIGLSGLTNDMRTLVKACAAGNERARLAIEVFCYYIKKFIGMLFAVLNGADAIVFTGGIGENQPLIRALACEQMEALGIEIDPDRNERVRAVEAPVSPGGAKTAVWVVPTNEELLIARETIRLLGSTS